MKQGIIIIAIIAVIALIGGIIGLNLNQPDGLGLATTEFRNYASDVIGTKIGTTTTGVLWPTSTTTKEYIIKTGGGIKQATFTVKPTVTPAAWSQDVFLNFYGSNDDYCDTATTTSVLDKVITSEINWFDIGTNLREFAGSQTIAGATSTITATFAKTIQGKVVNLTDLNYECLKVGVVASGTTLWAQVKTK